MDEQNFQKLISGLDDNSFVLLKLILCICVIGLNGTP